MNIKDNFPTHVDLHAKATDLAGKWQDQVDKDSVAVQGVIALIEQALAKKLAGFMYAPAAVVNYSLDRPYEYFFLTIVVQAPTKADAELLQKKLRTWQDKKMFPLKFPSTTSRQNTIGCMSVSDVGVWDDDEEGQWEGAENPLPDDNSFALSFQFVEW